MAGEPFIIVPARAMIHMEVRVSRLVEHAGWLAGWEGGHAVRQAVGRHAITSKGVISADGSMQPTCGRRD